MKALRHPINKLVTAIGISSDSGYAQITLYTNMSDILVHNVSDCNVYVFMRVLLFWMSACC